MTLRECVNTKFELVNKTADDSNAVLEWLEEALSIKADDEVSEEEIECICDRHWESTEDGMFNWLHDGDETPAEIYNASWVTEIDQVLVLEDGSCYFWYEIYN